MELIVGKTAGFCYGVQRAVKGAEEAENSKSLVYCLGEIVHNKQVIKSLEEKGMHFVEKIEDARGNVIIRAHGVPKVIYEKAEKLGINIKDFTCPNVLKIHKIAEDYAKKGYYIFLTGNKEHPENVGTASYCGNNLYVIENLEDTYKALENLQKSKINKLLVISQTTYSLEKFYKIEKIIKEELEPNIEVIIKNTICKATELRQRETEEISKSVDSMVIIGGKNSSNTKKLYEIAKQNCANTICIETKEEIDMIKIKDSNKIGIMAGASTPQESIDDVMEFLSNIK